MIAFAIDRTREGFNIKEAPKLPQPATLSLIIITLITKIIIIVIMTISIIRKSIVMIIRRRKLRSFNFFGYYFYYHYRLYSAHLGHPQFILMALYPNSLTAIRLAAHIDNASLPPS